MEELLELVNQYSATGKYDIDMKVEGPEGNIHSIRLFLKPHGKREGIKSLTELSMLEHKYKLSEGYKVRMDVDGVLKGDSQVEKIIFNVRKIGGR